MPITDDIVCIGPKGNKLCYILKNGLRSSKDVDEIIELYGKGLTKEELDAKGWLTIFA